MVIRPPKCLKVSRIVHSSSTQVIQLIYFAMFGMPIPGLWTRPKSPIDRFTRPVRSIISGGGSVAAAKKRLVFGSDLKSYVDVLCCWRCRFEMKGFLRVLRLTSLLKRIQTPSSIRRYPNKIQVMNRQYLPCVHQIAYCRCNMSAVHTKGLVPVLLTSLQHVP